MSESGKQNGFPLKLKLADSKGKVTSSSSSNLTFPNPLTHLRIKVKVYFKLNSTYLIAFLI